MNHPRSFPIQIMQFALFGIPPPLGKGSESHIPGRGYPNKRLFGTGVFLRWEGIKIQLVGQLSIWKHFRIQKKLEFKQARRNIFGQYLRLTNGGRQFGCYFGKDAILMRQEGLW